MNTSAPVRQPLHPLAWITGIAVIVLSAVGVGAVMGWIPTSMGESGSAEGKAAVESQAKGTAARTALTAPAKERITSETRRTPAQVVPDSPVRADRNPTIVASVKCAECGVIEAVRDVQTKGTGSGLGAVGGAVVGGVLGNQVGGGRGQDVMTVVGAIGGGLAGNEVEKRVKSTKSHVVTVRFDDGSTRDISTAADSAWRAGDKVKVVDGVIRANG